MKRLRRIMWNAMALLSLLISVAVGGLWIRSYWVEDIVSFPCEPVNRLHREMDLISTNGRIKFQFVLRAPQDWHEGFSWASWRGYMPTAEDIDQRERDDAVDYHGRYWGGFSFIRAAGNVYINLPHWGILSLIALPAVIFTAQRKFEKRVAGRCVNCGCDLRATPQKCPECGTVPGGQPKGTT